MLPNLVIIGAQKCGSTALHDYLGLHPDIFMSREKELTYFVAERNWSRGREWYERQFPVDRPIRGESSPSYTNYPRFHGVSERMHQLIPEAKLIYIVRDPIQRAIAHYLHRYADRDEHRTLDQSLADFTNDRNDYIQRGRYAMQLEQFLKFYPLARILVITQEQLLSDRRSTLRGVFSFLGVDENYDDPRFDQIKHESSRKRRKNMLARGLKRLADSRLGQLFPTSMRMKWGPIFYRPLSRQLPAPVLDPALRDKLRNYFRPDVERLRKLTSQRFVSWDY